MTVLRSPDAPPFVTYRDTSREGPEARPFRLPSRSAPAYSRTNLLIDHEPHPWSALSRLPDALNAYRQRVAVLREYGEEDGITLSTASQTAFSDFVKSNAYPRRASLVLLDNGNLRATWRGDDGSHVGIQFRGGQDASYVIFKRRQGGTDVSRVAGKDTLHGVRKQIRAFGLEALMAG